MKEEMIEKIDWQYMRSVVMAVEKRVFMELYEEELIDALVPWWMRRIHCVIETPKDGDPDDV